MNIIDALDILADLNARRDLERLSLEAQRKLILAPVQEALAIAELASQPVIGRLTEQIAVAEQAIKDAVLAAGSSVKGDKYHAIYMHGRVSWDAKKLDGYAAAYPEIAAFRTVGAPSVQIRSAR